MDRFSESIRIVRRNYCVPASSRFPSRSRLKTWRRSSRVRENLRTGVLFNWALNSGVPVLLRNSCSDQSPRRLAASGLLLSFLLLFRLRRIVLLSGIHLVTVRLVVPPCQTHERRDHVLARMHVTDHALRSWNAAGQLMSDWMTGFVLRNTYVRRLRPAEISRRTVKSRMPHIAIIRIDDVASSASRRSIVTA